METVTVLGSGGHGRDVAAIVRACGLHFAGYLDDNIADLGNWDTLSGPYVFGVHDPQVRAARDTRDFPAVILVHPSAYVEPDCEPGDGVVVGPRAIIGPGCRIYRHAHIGQGASLVRTIVGCYATISPGAVICGDVSIGDGAIIGAGAVVSNLCQIGDYAVVGAGAVLPPRTVVPPGTTWAGVPARPLREAA
jgi:carbonic anhydrase/acetyltransferase-like protein (isoleucine patch superfamily)